MTIGSVHLKRRGDSAIGIRWPGLVLRSPHFHSELAGLVEIDPLYLRECYKLGLTGYYVSDTELMFGLGSRSNRNTEHPGFRRCAGDDQREALVLMTDLIERAKQTNTRLYREDFAPSRSGKLGRGGTNDELVKPLIVIQRVQIPPDQSRADKSEASLAIHRATGGCEA